jgi:hypothetical protein
MGESKLRTEGRGAFSAHGSSVCYRVARFQELGGEERLCEVTLGFPLLRLRLVAPR